MSDDLFHIPETPLPPLEAARKRLAKAIEAEREAEELFDKQGPEAMPVLTDATIERQRALREVAKLEDEAMRRMGK